MCAVGKVTKMILLRKINSRVIRSFRTIFDIHFIGLQCTLSVIPYKYERQLFVCKIRAVY